MNAIGTQLRDPINSGLTRWRMGVSYGRRPVSKGRFKRSEFLIPNVRISGYVNTESIWSLQTYVCLKKNQSTPLCYLDFRAFFSCVFVFAICSLLSHLNVLTFVHPDWGMLRRSRRVLIFLYTLRRAALVSRTTTTYHIQQLCPMKDCNGKRESVIRTT